MNGKHREKRRLSAAIKSVGIFALCGPQGPSLIRTAVTGGYSAVRDMRRLYSGSLVGCGWKLFGRGVMRRAPCDSEHVVKCWGEMLW